MEEATREFSERLNRLYSKANIRKRISASTAIQDYDMDAESAELQCLAQEMASADFISRMEDRMAKAEHVVSGDIPAIETEKGYILKTGQTPLLMYV